MLQHKPLKMLQSQMDAVYTTQILEGNVISPVCQPVYACEYVSARHVTFENFDLEPSFSFTCREIFITSTSSMGNKVTCHIQGQKNVILYFTLFTSF